MERRELWSQTLAAMSKHLTAEFQSLVRKSSPRSLAINAGRRKRGDYNRISEYAAASSKYIEQGSRFAAQFVDEELLRLRAMFGWTNIHFFSVYFRMFDEDAQSEDRNHRFEFGTLTYYRHVILALLDFPEISLKTLDSMADDLQGVLSGRNRNIRDAVLARYWIAYERADLGQARTLYHAWLSTLNEESGVGCCKQDQALQMLRTEYRQKNFNSAINLGRGILQNQQSHLGACRDVREQSAIDLLAASLDAGSASDAQHAYDRAAKHTRIRRYPNEIAQLIRFHFSNGRIGRAALMVSNYLSLALQTHAARQRFQFLLAAVPVMVRMLENKHRALPVPANFYLPENVDLQVHGAEGIGLELLYQYCVKELNSIALRFDVRNRNTAHMDLLKKTLL